jgi:hypothetical protein
MKARVPTLCVGVILACTGCNQSTADSSADSTAKRIAALEAQVATLEKRHSDVVLKMRVVSGLLGSTLDNFFASPEFWEKTYDSGQADCAKRCSSTLTATLKECMKIADDTQRQKCIADAVKTASDCQTRCSASNQPPIR